MIRALDTMMVLVFLALILACLALSSCTQSQTREQVATEKLDRISVSGTVTVPTADGPRPMPVSFVIDRRGSEDQRREADTRTSVDGAAIGRDIAAVLGPLMLAASGGGVAWPTILAGIGGVATTAATGYLALKKREQIRAPKP